MANDRLTWQNVAAPDFSAAAQSTAVAARLFGDGMGSITGMLDKREGRQKDEASALALMQAQRYTDVASWDKAMAEKGIEGTLGVRPDQLNAEALAAIGQRRTDLLANDSTMAGTANTAASTQWGNISSSDDHKQSSQDLGQDAYLHDRVVAGDVESDAAKALQKEAATYIDVNSFGSIDPEATRQKIINDRSLDPKKREAYLAAHDAAAPMLYTPTQAALDQVSKMPEVAQVSEDLGTFTNEQLFKTSANPDLMKWTKAQEKFGQSGSPLKDLLASTNEYNGLQQSEDGETPVTFTTSAGKIQRAFADAKKAFPNVPDAVIAGVMEDAVRSGYWLLGDGQELKLDQGDAWATLEKFNDPKRRDELENQRMAAARESADVTSIKTDLAKTANELALAITKGLPDSVIQTKKNALLEIQKRASKLTGVPVSSADDNGDGIPDSVKAVLGVSAKGAAKSGNGRTTVATNKPGAIGSIVGATLKDQERKGFENEIKKYAQKDAAGVPYDPMEAAIQMMSELPADGYVNDVAPQIDLPQGELAGPSNSQDAQVKGRLKILRDFSNGNGPAPSKDYDTVMKIMGLMQ